MAKRPDGRAKRPTRRSTASTPAIRKAIAFGRRRADEAIASRTRARSASKGLPGANGVLLAEGDSWFDYPFHDVLSLLESAHNFRIESAAHKGDTVEEMAYDLGQSTSLARKMDNLQHDRRVPRAVLLSGGGNDLAGDEFAILLNHARSGLPTLNLRVVDGIINERLRFAMAALISTVTRLSSEYFGRVLPVVIHGYAYAVPDGRGYLGGSWILPGPWLEPGFRQKGHDTLSKNTRVMVELIDAYNGMLEALASRPEFAHVKYVNMRKLLSNELPGRAYRKSWENELHPTKAGFGLVADAFAKVLLSL
jgi:lysophospholipase L1-like esterase